MTYTIIGRCHRTGRLGIGIATFSITVGRYSRGVRAMAGVTIAQAFARETNNALALRLLGQGFSAWAVLEHLKSDTPIRLSQIVSSSRSKVRCLHWTRTRRSSGHVPGKNYVATSNSLVGPGVVEAIAAGFLAEPNGDLEHRLLMSIEAGHDAGGQGSKEAHKPERSAALSVYSRHAYADIDLRVDLHETAVEELRRVWREYKKYEKATTGSAASIRAARSGRRPSWRSCARRGREMTYSIIARCLHTGRLGLGITTFSIAAGGRCGRNLRRRRHRQDAGLRQSRQRHAGARAARPRLRPGARHADARGERSRPRLSPDRHPRSRRHGSGAYRLVDATMVRPQDRRGFHRLRQCARRAAGDRRHRRGVQR